MVHRTALDYDVSRDGVLLQIVLLSEALHLFFTLFLNRQAVLRFDVQPGSLGFRSRGQQRHRSNDQDRLDVFASWHLMS